MKKLLLAAALSVAVLTSGNAFAQKVSYVDPSWQTSLVQQLQRFKRYPAEAQTRSEQGAVLLSLSLDRNGHVLAYSIAHSSGHADLDNEVMEMIKRAEPLPPFPASMTQARIDLTVPIQFSLSLPSGRVPLDRAANDARLKQMQEQVVLDHIDLVDDLFRAKGAKSAIYHIINRGLDAVRVTVVCDLVSATDEVLMSATGEVLYPSPDAVLAALTVGFGGASFLDDGAQSLLATMQATNVRCNVTTEAVKQPPQSVGPARIDDRGPTHGSPTAPHGLRGALACPSPPVLANLVDVEKGYLNEEMDRLGPFSEVAGWHAEEAMVRWALDHGCQALSDGTRLDVRGALLWERLVEFVLCVGSPCVWVRRDDVEGDFHETMSRGNTAPPSPNPLHASTTAQAESRTVASVNNAPTETLKLIRQGYVIARLPWNWDEQVKPGSWLMEAYLMYAMVYRCSEAHVRYLTLMQVAADLMSPRRQLPLDGAGRVVLNFDASVIRRSFEALTAIKAAALKQDPNLNIDNMRAEANKLHIDNFEKCLWEAQLLTKMEHELSRTQ